MVTSVKIIAMAKGEGKNRLKMVSMVRVMSIWLK